MTTQIAIQQPTILSKDGKTLTVNSQDRMIKFLTNSGFNEPKTLSQWVDFVTPFDGHIDNRTIGWAVILGGFEITIRLIPRSVFEDDNADAYLYVVTEIERIL